jgi:hypothetical protein
MRHPRVVGFHLAACLACLAPCASAVDRAGERASRPLRLMHEHCSQGVAFFSVDRASVTRLLPNGLRPMDARLFLPSYAGRSAIALIQTDCEQDGANEGPLSFTVVASPLESLIVDGTVIGPVRFDWFTFARFVDGRKGEGRQLPLGLGFDGAAFTKTITPSSSGPAGAFTATHRRDTLYSFDVASETAYDLPAQAHRFWSHAGGRFGYAQMTFPVHHSWIGRVPSCRLGSRFPLMRVLGAEPCVSKLVLSEIIESVTFEEVVIPLGAASPRATEPQSGSH